MSDWALHETSKHQDHVIAHVLGATVLGYFEHDQAAYLTLDIGFIWVVFLDGEMGLVPGTMAINELELGKDVKSALLADTTSLQNDPDAGGLNRITRAPAGCLISEVNFYARDDERRVMIVGESACLNVDTSLQTGEIRVTLAEEDTGSV